MATTIIQAFDEYRRNLEITDKQESLVATRRADVVRVLKTGLVLHPEESKVTGSWDRNTLIRYLREGDVDTMIILDANEYKHWDTPAGTINALDRFKSLLNTAFPFREKCRDRNCITLQFPEFCLDVVPAFKQADGYFSYYRIPDSVRQKWVSTDPFRFALKVTEVNKALNNQFVPLIKMVKGWNRAVGWPIRGFHLECLLHQHFQGSSIAYSYPWMLRDFFKALPGLLMGACYEPVLLDQVDTYLDNNAQKTQRQIAVGYAQAAAAAAEEAYNDQEKYPSVAIREWKALLGEFFPIYG